MNENQKLLTETQLSEIEARANAATEGPWRDALWIGILEWPEGNVKTVMSHGPIHKLVDPVGQGLAVFDSEFIAHSRTDIPALIAMIREQERLLDNAEGSFENIINQTRFFIHKDELRAFKICSEISMQALRELREIRKPKG